MEISAEDNLHVNLSEIIEKNYWNLLRVAHSNMVTLFWEIGKELNHFFDETKTPKYRNAVIFLISKELVARNGNYFSAKNIKAMCEFAVQFPDLPAVTQVIPFVSWEHILVLLKIEELEKKLFYIKLTAKQDLSVSNLRKQIARNVYEKKYASTVKNGSGKNLAQALKDNLFLQILLPELKQTFIKNRIIKNFFKPRLLPSFRRLTEPSKKQVRPDKEKRMHADERKLYELVSGCIEKYRRGQNRGLNAYLNFSFWEIGSRINRETPQNNKSKSYRGPLIRKVSLRLKKVFGRSFSEMQLNSMAGFARQCADPGTATQISYLVSWGHILVLLSLDEIEAMLFYATVSAKQGLSAADLRKQVKKNGYENSKRVKIEEEKRKNVLYSSASKTTTKRQGNSTIKVTTKLIERQDTGDNDLKATNIFKNPYFLDFVTAF